jgi:branched-chain amino acid transport system substrate-binding protein
MANANSEPMTIFVGAPMSGPLNGFGKQISAGVRAAAAVHRRDIDDSQIEFSFQDDACQKNQAVAIAENLVRQHAKMMIGHVCSVTSIGVSDIYADNKIVMLSAASSNSRLTERGLHYVFRVSGRDDVQAVAATKLMTEWFAKSQFVVVFEDEVSGKGHSEQFIKKMAETGRTPAAVYPLKDVSDVNSIVDSPAFRAAAVVYYAGHQPQELAAVLKAAREKGIGAQFLSNDGANNRALWNSAGDAAEGLLFTFDPDYAAAPAAETAVAELKTLGEGSNGFALPAFAAAEILIQAASELRKHPETDLDAYLHATRFRTALGPVSFDAKGDFAEFYSVIYRWRAGQVVLEKTR